MTILKCSAIIYIIKNVSAIVHLHKGRFFMTTVKEMESKGMRFVLDPKRRNVVQQAERADGTRIEGLVQDGYEMRNARTMPIFDMVENPETAAYEGRAPKPPKMRVLTQDLSQYTGNDVSGLYHVVDVCEAGTRRVVGSRIISNEGEPLTPVIDRASVSAMSKFAVSGNAQDALGLIDRATKLGDIDKVIPFVRYCVESHMQTQEDSRLIAANLNLFNEFISASIEKRNEIVAASVAGQEKRENLEELRRNALGSIESIESVAQSENNRERE